MAAGWVTCGGGVGLWAYGVAVFAESAADAGMPTSLTGALILTLVTLVGLVVWVVKQQFGTIEKLTTTIQTGQNAATAVVEKYQAFAAAQHQQCEAEKVVEREAHERRLVLVLAAVKEEAAQERAHLTRERELTAELFDALRHREENRKP
jgi:hypothetical protein